MYVEWKLWKGIDSGNIHYHRSLFFLAKEGESMKNGN